MSVLALVTIDGVALVADVDQYKPMFWPPRREFDGIGAVTIQDPGQPIHKARGALASGNGAGLISQEQLDDLLALFDDAGDSQTFSDDLNNAGTVKLTSFVHDFARKAPVGGALFSYQLAWRWLTMTTRYGTSL